MNDPFLYQGVNMLRLIQFLQNRSSINPYYESKNFFTGSVGYSNNDYYQGMGRDENDKPISKSLMVFAGLNTKRANLDINLARCQLGYSAKSGVYSLWLPYYANVGQPVEYAIRIYSSDIEDFLQVTDLIFSGSRTRFFNILFAMAKKQLNAVAKDDNIALARWYEYASPYVIVGIELNTRINHLDVMLSGNVSQYGRADTEKAILNLLRSFLPKYNNEPAKLKPDQLVNTQATLLFYMLTEKGTNTKKILFNALYGKMNDFGGADNFTAAMLLLYRLWDNSVFKLPSYIEYKKFPAQTNLPYSSEKKFGFYQTSLSFELKETTIYVEEKKFKEVYQAKSDLPYEQEYYVPFGTYHIFQPVAACGSKKQGGLPLPVFEMPAFYLKAAADKNKWDNIEKGTFLAVDVVSLFIGVGMFVRLAETVQVLSKARKAFVLLNATLQVSSGAVGTMLNFVDEDKYPEFCSKLRTVLLVLDLATLGGDFVTGKMMKEAAEDALKNVPDAARKEKGFKEVEEELNKLSGNKLQKFATVGSGGKLSYLVVVSRKVFGQEEPMSCAAACIRQLVNDAGVTINEAKIRELAGTWEKGTPIGKNISETLSSLTKREYIGGFMDIAGSNISVEKAIEIFTKKGSWIAVVKAQDQIEHAIIVDKVVDGKVYIRDPWPLEGIEGIKQNKNGVEAIVDLDDFIKAWDNASTPAFYLK